MSHHTAGSCGRGRERAAHLLQRVARSLARVQLEQEVAHALAQRQGLDEGSWANERHLMQKLWTVQERRSI